MKLALGFTKNFGRGEVYMWQSKFRFSSVKLDINNPRSTILSLLLPLVFIGSNLFAVTPTASAQTNASTCVQKSEYKSVTKPN